MTVPGYDGCDCDKYNPDCRCHPKETTMTAHDTTDHVDAIMARCEEYDTLGLVGRNSTDDIRRHVRALAARLAVVEARCNRYDIAMLAAASYIERMEQGKGPSDPAYLPLRDYYRNAVDDLPDTTDGGDDA